MAGEDEYFVAKGSLKLKGVSDAGVKKKKKKKKKDLERQMEANILREADQSEISEEPVPTSRFRTEAELRFMERRRKMEAERILKKASKTHKEKVEDFNRHLDSLTEHFDIPKVSWTK